MKSEDLFHLGIVTATFEQTRDELSSLFGYEWGPEVGGPIDVSLPSGDATVNLRCAYSVTMPRLEIVRAVPDSPLWDVNKDQGIHHAGYWSDDVAADSAELLAHGYITEATRLGPDGVPFFTFHRSPWGLRIELVSRVAKSALQQCWASPVGVESENGTQS